MEITGIIKQIGGVITINGKNGEMQKSTVIIETQEEYPNSLAIDFFGDKMQQLAGLTQGALVHCVYNAKAREYNGKCFNSLNAYKIDRIQPQVPAAPPAPASSPTTNNIPF